MATIKLSEEQEAVAYAVVAQRRNVVSISKPGTGKSTMAFEIARRREGRTLILTYNSKLKEEGRERARRMDLLDRVEVHSFHAAALHLCEIDSENGADDSALMEALGAAPQPFERFSLVVLDEAQDLTPLFYQFVKRLLTVNGACQMLIVGDPFQRINSYLGASWRYMNLPEEHFGHLLWSAAFCELHLSVCWRITPEMAKWINQNLDPRNLEHTTDPGWWAEHGELITRWWGDGVRSDRAPSPGSMRTFVEERDDDELAQTVSEALERYLPSECAVLTSTVRTPKPTVSALMRRLPGVRWAVAPDQRIPWEGGADAVALHKVAVSTVHRFKGLERRVVVVTELDARKEQREDPLVTFAYFFVAVTRAQDLLLVVHGTVPYATMRRTRLPPPPAKRARPTELTSILRHAPFDPWLSVPMSRGGFLDKGPLQIQKDETDDDRVEACRFVRAGEGGVEDAAVYLADAVIWLVMCRMDADCDAQLRETRRIGGGEAMRELRDIVRPLSEENAFQLAVAERSRARGFPHMWRQHRRCSLHLGELIGDLADVAVEMLSYLGAEFEACTVERYDSSEVDVSAIKCVPHFCKSLVTREGRPLLLRSRSGARKIAHVLVAPVVQHEDVLTAALWGAFDAVMIGEDTRCTPSFLILANQGVAYEVNVNSGDAQEASEVSAYEILVRALLRKCVGEIEPHLIDLAIEELESAPRFFS